MRQYAAYSASITPSAFSACRLRLLKIGTLVRTRMRGIKLAMPSSAFPYQAEYRDTDAASRRRYNTVDHVGPGEQLRRSIGAQ
jgi:hypothetical protein